MSKGDNRKLKYEEIDRIFQIDFIRGTYVVYGVKDDCFTPFVCDLEFDTLTESDHKNLRCSHLRDRRDGKPMRRPRRDALHDELIVAFGPEMSARAAVTSLRNLAREIQKHGLLIGRFAESADSDGDFECETVEGAIVR